MSKKNKKDTRSKNVKHDVEGTIKMLKNAGNYFKGLEKELNSKISKIILDVE